MDETTRALIEEIRSLRQRVSDLENSSEEDTRSAAGTPIYSSLSAGLVVFTNTDKSLTTNSNLIYSVAGGVLKSKTGLAVHNAATAISGSGGLAVGTSAMPGDGKATISGTLAVGGLTTLSAGLNVTGAATVSTTLGVTGVLTASNNLNVAGALKVGSPSYTPSAGQISAQGAIVAGGYMHPGNQTTYGITYWAGGGLSVNGNLSLVGALYPTNQATYYWNVQTATYPNTMYNNNIVEAAGGFVGGSWFRSLGATGWYNNTYGGGIFMQGGTYVEVYGGKGFYAPAAANHGFGVAGVSNWCVGVQGVNSSAGSYALVVRNSAAANLMYLENNGAAWVNSAWIVASDRRLKSQITPVAPADALAVVLGLKPVTYTLNREDNERLHSGYVAQDVEEVLPHTVSVAEDGTLALTYEEINPYLTGAIQELTRQLATNRAETESIRAELASIRAVLAGNKE